MSRDDDIDRQLGIMRSALKDIAASRDCDYFDVPEEERQQPCDCAVCVAKNALDSMNEWRFESGMPERMEHNPRERKIVAAWKKFMRGVHDRGAPDRLLANILRESTAPTSRDWLVATSVVQWLATNVGMTVLEAAGFKYTQFEDDRAERDAKEQP